MQPPLEAALGTWFDVGNPNRVFFIELGWWQPLLLMLIGFLVWKLMRIQSLQEKEKVATPPIGEPRPISLWRWLLWVPPLAWAIFIFWLSSKTKPPDPGPSFEFKAKVGHYVLFTILSGLLAAPLAWTHRFPLRKTVTWALALAVLYGVTDEFHQAFVPPRTSMIADCATDALGAIFGVALFYLYESLRGAKKNH